MNGNTQAFKCFWSHLQLGVCVWHMHTLSVLVAFGCHSGRMCDYLLESRLPPPGMYYSFLPVVPSGWLQRKVQLWEGKKLSAILDLNRNFIYSVETRESAFEPNWFGCVTDSEGPKEFLSEKVRCVSIQRMIWEKQLEPGWLSSLGFLLLAPYLGFLLLWRGVMTTAALTNGNTETRNWGWLTASEIVSIIVIAGSITACRPGAGEGVRILHLDL